MDSSIGRIYGNGGGGVLSFFCIHHKLHCQQRCQPEAADEALLCHLFRYHVVGVLDDQQQVLALFRQALDQALEGIFGFLWEVILAFPFTVGAVQRFQQVLHASPQPS